MNAKKDNYGRKGRLILEVRVPKEEAHLVQMQEMENIRRLEDANGEAVFVGERDNIYVDTGLQNSLDREFGLGGNPVIRMAITNDNTAVTNATTELDPTEDSTVVIKAFDATFPSRTGNTVSVEATFTKADGNIAVYKLGLLSGTTDDSPNLVDAIGGGLANPFVNLTTLSDWTIRPRIEVTASAV